jgi:hypothetical protein
VRSTAIEVNEMAAGQTVAAGGSTTLDGSEGLPLRKVQSSQVESGGDPPGGDSGNPLEGSQQDVVGELAFLTKLVNREAFKAERRRNTCILSSFALQHVLTKLGYPDVKLLRVTACVWGEHFGVGLGALPDDGTRGASSKGKWIGHLVVVVNGCFLLDPTLDQANQKDIKAEPCVLRIPPTFSDGTGDWVSFTSGNCKGWYVAYDRQVGFRYTQAARPKYWKPIANAVLTAYERGQNGFKADNVLQGAIR